MNCRSLGLLVLPLALLLPSVADASVKREGDWPDPDKRVTLDLKNVPRADAVSELAKAAGWNVVLHAQAGEPVTMHAVNQPAASVLDALLSDTDYTAHRDGDLVVINPLSPVAPNPPAVAPAPPPLPSSPPHAEPARKSGNDRNVFGSDVRIERDEVVRDLQVMGGSVELLGTVTGDMKVVGGNVDMLEDSRVMGDVIVTGGNVDLHDRSRIDGKATLIAGNVDKHDNAKILGGTEGKYDFDNVHVKVKGGKDHGDNESWLTRAWDALGDAMGMAAGFFMMGAIFFALAPRRMDTLRVGIAANPIRLFAMGMVATLAFALVAVAACVTIIGIPVAVVAVILACVGLFAGMCAILNVVGEALFRHRTKNAYVHLAIGCAIFAILMAIPQVAPFVASAVLFIGIGSLATTRFAGFIPPRKRGTPVGTYQAPVEQ